MERQILAAAGTTFCTLFVGLSVVLFVRRLSGAFVAPPGSGVLIASALAAGLTAGVLRWVSACGGPAPSAEYVVLSTLPWRASVSYAYFALPGIAAFLLLAALTFPATAAAGVGLAWFLLAGSEAASWLALFRGAQLPLGRNVSRPIAVAATLPEPEAELPSGLVQQLTRIREAGHETLHAVMQAEVAAGDRLAVVHVSFCPPLGAIPEIAAHAIDAEDAEVRVAQAESFGARIEVRFPHAADQPRRVLVEVLGSAALADSGS